MLGALVILFTLPISALSAGDGNIHLLEEEVAAAIRSCSQITKTNSTDIPNRQRRFAINRYDDETQSNTNRNPEKNHSRRNSSFINKIHILNETNNDYLGYVNGDRDEKLINSIPRPALNNTNIKYNDSTMKRTKRNEPLLSKDDNDQCLSQCVFANLQVVDSQGIPREAELWDKVQTTMASQQSRVLLKDQIRACFQELQSESEDDGCSYSNKLERCLMLRFSDRKTRNVTQNN